MSMSQGLTGSQYRQGTKSISPQPRPIFEMPPELMQSKGPLLRSGNFAGGANSNSFQVSQKQASQDFTRNYDDIGKQDIEPPNFGKSSMKNSYTLQNQYGYQQAPGYSQPPAYQQAPAYQQTPSYQQTSGYQSTPVQQQIPSYQQAPLPYQSNYEPLVKPEQVRTSSNYNPPSTSNYQVPVVETNFQPKTPDQKNFVATQSFNNSYGASVKYEQPFYNYQQANNPPESVPITYKMDNVPSQQQKKTFDEVNEGAPEPEYEAVCKIF